MTRPAPYLGPKAGWVPAFLLFAGIVAAQTGPALNMAAAATPGIAYSDGQLKINVLNTTLAEVLGKVAALTGVTIDIPASAGSERMQVVELGPGPARQILASLLSESNFDYLIQGSDADPAKIQSVLLMPRGKKDSAPGGVEAAGRPFRSPYSRAAAPPPPPPEEPPAPEPPAPAAPAIVPPGLVPVDPSSPPVVPQPVPPGSDTPATQPDQTPPPLPSLPLPPGAEQPINLPQGLSPDPSNRPGALLPPPVMNQQSINQQLQQMYQQRVQILQSVQGQAGSGH